MRLLLLWLCLAPVAMADLHVAYTRSDQSVDLYGEPIPAEVWIKGDKLLVRNWNGTRTLVRGDLGYQVTLDAKGRITRVQAFARLKETDRPRLTVGEGEAAKVAGLACRRLVVKRLGDVVAEIWALPSEGAVWNHYVGGRMFLRGGAKAAKAIGGAWLKLKVKDKVTLTARAVQRDALKAARFAVPVSIPDGQTEASFLADWVKRSRE